MSKKPIPTTQAIRFLRTHNVVFEAFEYDYVEHGGTAHSAQELGVDEHCVIKTIVLQDENRNAMIVLMHGDCEISTRNMARFLGVKHIDTVKPETVTKLTGFLVGGCSPFGTKQALPVYVEKSILALPEIYINGGKRGFLVKINPQDLQVLQPIAVEVAVK
ncbi:MAG: Cys-tRNA(Pro) deacylase [Neisseriaceae bacterium]|nr:Cys-tRNA(Pro) deacylase [Neisseriaceae bacterium]